MKHKPIQFDPPLRRQRPPAWAVDLILCLLGTIGLIVLGWCYLWPFWMLLD